MTQRGLAVDLDGTLLVGETLSERNRLALKRASDLGFRVIIATARWRQMAERIGRIIGIGEQPIIACSGAQVYSMRDGNDIYDVRLPRTFVQQFFDICNNNRCIASATVDARTWLKMDQRPAPEYLSDEMQWVEQLPDRLATQADLPRIATLQGSETIAAVRALQRASYTDDHAEPINIFDSIGPTGRTVITITARDADKGIALGHACEYLSLAPENVIAFGDADNDIAMFRRAGTSVAMGQADAAVKQAATHVTAANTADGVAEFIERELL